MNSAAPIAHRLEGVPLAGREPWYWLGALGLVFVYLHGYFLIRTFRIATNAKGEGLLELLLGAFGSSWNPDWSHVLVIPFISGYFIWQSRSKLSRVPLRVSVAGLPLLLVGLLSYAWWLGPGRNDMFSGYSMIVSLLGLAWFLLGGSALRVLWAPIVYLVFAVKVSDRLWEWIAWKLQLAAAGTSTVLLEMLGSLLGFDAESRGSTIELSFAVGGVWQTESLNVAEACSGLRMLSAFLALGVAMAMLGERLWWQRLIMILMAVPIAVAVNVGRVTTLGLLYVYNPKLATGDFHTFVGMMMLIPAAGLFWLLGWVLERVVIVEKPTAAATQGSVQGSSPGAERPRLVMTGSLSLSAWGAVTGAGMVVLLGVCVASWVYRVRPDFMPWLHPTLAGVARWVTLLGVVGLAVWGWRWARRSRSQAGLSRGAMGVALGVLLAAALGINGTVRAMQVVLIKEPVPLRLSPLSVYVPANVGPYEAVGKDEVFTPEILEALGTDVYLSRVYIDTEAQPQSPGSIVRLHVAYYTGIVDTVPHVPDRCFVAGGMAPLNSSHGVMTIKPLPGVYQEAEDGGYVVQPMTGREAVRLRDLTLQATTFTFSVGGSTSNVSYFFHANGRVLATPEQVRLQGFDLRDRYSYYCKIELLWPGVEDPEASKRLSARFLAYVYPELLAILPDWEQVKAGQWPPSNTNPMQP